MLVPWRVSFYTETMNKHQTRNLNAVPELRVFRSQLYPPANPLWWDMASFPGELTRDDSKFG